MSRSRADAARELAGFRAARRVLVDGTAMRELVVIVGLWSVPAFADEHCFEEYFGGAVNVGVSSIHTFGSSEDGWAPIAELQLRRWVSPRASVSGYLSYAAYTWQREFYGTYHPIDHSVALAGVRLAFHPTPRVSLGVDVGGFRHRRVDRDDHSDEVSYFELVGVFVDVAAIQIGPLDITVGARMDAGLAWLRTLVVGASW